MRSMCMPNISESPILTVHVSLFGFILLLKNIHTVLFTFKDSLLALKVCRSSFM